MNASSALAPRDARDEKLYNVTLLDYILHLVCIVFSLGMANVIPLIINYVKRDDARGTIYESHMSWQIRSFWWFLLWVIVIAVPAALLTVLTFGLFSFLFIIPAIWFVYRMIKGMLWLRDGRAMPL